MKVDEPALVLVMPDDTVETIIVKVREAQTANVELLVPEGVLLFQDSDRCRRIQQTASRENITLLLIASDQATLQAAGQANISIIGVHDTQVTLPSTPVARPAARTPSTQSRKRDAGAAASTAAALASETSNRDADFMAELDDLSDLMRMDPEDSMPSSTRDRSSGNAADDDFAAALDDFSAVMDDSRPATARSSGNADDDDLRRHSMILARRWTIRDRLRPDHQVTLVMTTLPRLG
ncbi:MAG: hypothetical protein HC837_02645 [Chloroflexaceae bacterium]|nr:hypothetical protein [Chloroflexaceae bacterium]